MGKCTEVTILALLGTRRIAFTELGLVHLRVIELFYCVVGESAGVSKRAHFLF